MPNKRAASKKYIGGYIPGVIRDRFKTVARRKELADTDALIEAITDYADKHEPRHENGEEPKP